jgi:hypothetical protein
MGHQTEHTQMKDGERATAALKGIEGKRLTYRILSTFLILRQKLDQGAAWKRCNFHQTLRMSRNLKPTTIKSSNKMAGKFARWRKRQRLKAKPNCQSDPSASDQ